ncbi:MAG: hypothetical protein JXR07_13030 [Reichenbachiella sp.]
MKTLSFILITLMSTTAFAGGGKSFEKAMVGSIEKLYVVSENSEYDVMANQFTRIGEAEKDQWEPFYYASLSYLFKAFEIADLKAKDAILDQAMASLKSANNISENVETIALKGFINMIKIGVDPATRGQSLSPGIYADFGKAMQMEPTNPRATLFMAQMQHGTAQFFGKGEEEACQLVDHSLKLFDNYEPSNALAPTWGKSSAIYYQKKCNKEASN